MILYGLTKTHSGKIFRGVLLKDPIILHPRGNKGAYNDFKH